jgi:hypothetical protein
VFQHRTTTVKASPFKVASETLDVKKVIEQNNYTNQYLNSIGNQLDKIEEKLNSKPLKQENPLVKFPKLKSGTSLKVNKNTPLEQIEEMLKDLAKAKQEQPSTSNTVSVAKIPESSENSSETESSSESDSDENIRKVEKALSSLELNRIHKPKFPIASLTKNWYPRPTPPDIEFEERNFQSQFAVSTDKLYEWNIDGLSEQQILDKLTHMMMVSNSYVMNHDLSQPEVMDLLVSGFTGTLQAWWEKHLTDESKASIRKSVKIDKEGISVFNERVGLGEPDAINTLFYTIIEHFVGTLSHLTSRVHDQLSNLRCPTLNDFRWYKDVFLSRVMLRDDSNQPFWKEKFINGLPHLFAHKIKQVLVNEHNVIEYDNLTYGNMISAIQKEGLRMCIDMKISNQANKDKKKAKYEMGNFCEQYDLPSVAPSKKHKKSRKHEESRKYKKRFKRFKKRSFEPNEFYKKDKRKQPKRKRFNYSKEGCYKCGKSGHFAKDCKAKETIKSLKVSNEEKENLIRMLEIQDNEPSDNESELSISSSESYCSCSSNKSGPDISFGCNDTCCKTIGVMTKEEEQEELLLDLISKIQTPELKRQYLEKLRKLLTKREVSKSKSQEISLSNTLKKFDQPKKQVSIKDLQLEVNQIKSEIKILKKENQDLRQDVNILKIEHKLKSAASSHNDSEAEPEPKPEDTPPFEESCISLINRIHIRKWHSKVRIKIQDFELSVVVLIDTGADLNYIQEGLVPTKYYSKLKETLRSANGSKMQITFEINKAHVCQDNVCFKTTFVLVKNMTDKVILGLPFITLLYPFTTDQDGLITYPMDENVKFKFLASP